VELKIAALIFEKNLSQQSRSEINQ